MKIRIKFAKRGAMKFVGHLDMMRYFQKAIRRANVAVVYSEGFSPHQKMSFAAPLGVGLTSEGEYLDIEVSDSLSSAKMLEVCNQVMAEGIEVLSWRRLPDQAKNAMALVAAADYRLTFREGYQPKEMEQFYQGFLEFVQAESILIIKKTKKGERELDLKPLIYQAAVEEDGSLFLRVCAGSSENIKPESILQTYYQNRLKQEIPMFAFQIQRLELYANIGTEQEKQFVPLEALGDEID
ncbi:MAG: TIGR03936 family radical SAM-associated protein [Lachnospiraceae bacterium]|nr:TIGR03936 family radical SAM-associated protein [Lachnospiraceae bacterium]